MSTPVAKPVNHSHIYFRSTLKYMDAGVWMAKYLCALLCGPTAEIGPNNDRDPAHNWDLGQNNDYWLWEKQDYEGNWYFHFACRYGLYETEHQAIRTLLVERARCVIIEDPTKNPPAISHAG